ncbi:MAG: thermonuclease family protein [Methanobrevibacter sp.]|nr:thermonuclease family protein [Methanobrevibacter sp.]
MLKLNKHHIFIIFIILLLVGVMGCAAAYTGTGFSHDKRISDYDSLSLNDILSKYSDTNCKPEAKGLCTHVADGDTITVEGVGKVRLVGVNTPEKGVSGSDASTFFTKKLCLNREVNLDIDDSKHTDKYGRTLAVVIVDGKNLNEMLLKEGLAEIMYMPPSEFYPYDWAGDNTHVASQTSASKNTSSSPTNDAGTYIGNTNSHKFHHPSCKYGVKISEKNKITFSSRDEAINKGYAPCNICNP